MNKPVHNYPDAFISLLALIIALSSCFWHPTPKQGQKRLKWPLNDFKQAYLSLDPLNLTYRDIINNGIKYPIIVTKQAVLETGWFTSKAYHINNNLYGFSPDGINHLKFNSLAHSTVFYKRWQDKNYIKGNYYKFLNNIKYAEDSQYTNVLQCINFKKEYNDARRKWWKPIKTAEGYNGSPKGLRKIRGG